MSLRIAVAAVAGAIALVLLEALTYGVVIPDFINANRVPYTGLIKDPPNIIAVLLFNLVWSSLLAVIFDRWAGIRTFAAGAFTGAAIMVAVVLGINFGYLAFFNLLKNPVTVIAVKAIAMAVTAALVGGLMAVILGKMRREGARV